jgi:polysaccharide biosynthesis/export protein
MIRFSLGCAAVLALAGCAKEPPLVTTPHLSVVGGDALPPPTRADLGGGLRDYAIGPADKLKVDVFGLPDLSTTVEVEPNGRVALPLAGGIMAAGLTADELERRITQALVAQHVRDPRVTVGIAESVSQTVTIDGEVRTPGVYPAFAGMTLIRTIARAQGATEFAKLDHVVVIRQVDGKRYAALYDLRAIRQGLYADPDIFAKDLVLVGTNQARRIFRDILQASPLLTTPIIAILQTT